MEEAVVRTLRLERAVSNFINKIKCKLQIKCCCKSDCYTDEELTEN